jgi:hypothetical protein
MLSPLEIKYRLLSFFCYLFVHTASCWEKSDLCRRRNIELYSRNFTLIFSLPWNQGEGNFRNHSHQITLVLQNMFKFFCYYISIYSWKDLCGHKCDHKFVTRRDSSVSAVTRVRAERQWRGTSVSGRRKSLLSSKLFRLVARYIYTPSCVGVPGILFPGKMFGVWRFHTPTCIKLCIPSTDLDMPTGFQESDAHRFQDSQHMKAVRLSTLRTGLHYRPRNIPGTNFC